MKILVTVGTTEFDNLVKAADEQLSNNYELIFQIAKGSYTPKNNYIRYTDDIEQYYQEAELIISHGGAGTIFRALELNKKLVIVPNLDRLDHHQLDICDFMNKNHHAITCENLNELAAQVKKVATYNFIPYKAEEFTGINKIRDFLGLSI